MSALRQHTELLVHAGRLLLEYDESTAGIHRKVAATAKALTDEQCHVSVSYGQVAVSLASEAPMTMSVGEIRYNSVVHARVHDILNLVRHGQLSPATALEQLRRIETDTPRHSRWVAVVILGAAAASLAGLLGADAGAAIVAGLSTGVGLMARQELGRRHFSLLALPMTAAFIGAVFGGLTIRWGWTRTPELVLIVPALMLVPGPHLINGVLDLLDNYVPMCLARFGLATSIILATALGIVLGIELTLPGPPLPRNGGGTDHLNLVSDMVLAGIATCGFAAFYNTSWGQMGMAAVGGMAGHGLRFLALGAGFGLEVATFVGSLTVGIASAWMARSGRTPVAVIAFAGAVTMMPGLHMYRAFGGALKLAHRTSEADSAMIAEMLGNAIQACLVVGGLAVGVICGARMVLALTGELAFAASSSSRLPACGVVGTTDQAD